MNGAVTRLAVDLGTTWTAAALQQAGSVAPLSLGTDAPAMPSVLAIDGSEIVAGERAERQLLVDPTSGVREAKRRLGDTAPMVMALKPFGAEALMGHLLRHVIDVAADEAGGQPEEVVLTHPAIWGDFKLDLVREAGRQAGAGEVTLMPEPVAAALHYVGLGRIAAGDVVAVYDFGGGTFDAAVVQCTGRGAEILGAPEGLERVGGVDLDQIVLLHVDQALDGRTRELDSTAPEGRRGLARLRAECTAAKEALSSDTEVTIPVALPGLHTEVRMTRDEFEAGARARIADTLGALDRAIANAGVRQSALAGVLLVGGSSRIPVVAEEVSRRTGRPTLLDADPKLVVALGAAGGNTVMSPKKTSDPADPAESTTGAARPSSPPPPPPSPGPSAAAQAGARAAALRAAAGGPPPAKKRSGAATAAGAAAAAAGVAAAGYAAYEFLGDDDKGSDEAADAELAADLLEKLDESLDAFDDLGGGGRNGGNAGGGGGRGGGAGLRAVGGAAPGVAGRRSSDRPATGETEPELADISEARAELLERLAAWEPPANADPAEVAAFRAELEGLINRFQPRPGQSANDALADLRAQFNDQVEDFVQDLKLDAIIDHQNQQDPAPGGPQSPQGPHWEWNPSQGRWEWDDGSAPVTQAPARPGFEWVPRHVDERGQVVEGHWERPPAGGIHADRPGLAWVEAGVDAYGRPVPAHWEPASPAPAPTAPAPPYNVPMPETANVRTWVEGHYDEHGNYVRGRWVESSVENPTPKPVEGDDAPPPIIQNPYTPPPPPVPPAPAPQTVPSGDPYRPTVRDHRGESYDDRATSGGVVVRDHRGDDTRPAPQPRDPGTLTSSGGVRETLEDVFDQVRPYIPGQPGQYQPPTVPGLPAHDPAYQPYAARTVSVGTGVPPQVPEMQPYVAGVTGVAGAGAGADGAEPAATDGLPTGEPLDPGASSTTADDLLGVEAFSDASAEAPTLGLADEIPAAPEPDPVPVPEPAPAPSPAPTTARDLPQEPVMTVVDPTSAEALGAVPEAPVLHDPDPEDADDDTPDLDHNPHTPQ